MDKLWSKTEVSHLKRNADKQTVEELAERFHTDAETVRVKMEELGLAANPSGAGSTDAMVDRFTQGVEALYKGELDDAVEHFETIQKNAEGRQLRDRAAQYLQICHAQKAGDDSIDDPYLAAVVAKNQGDLEKAAELAGQGDQNDEKFAYLSASLKALGGDDDGALELLARAIELEPRNRVHAYHDPDFRELREVEGASSLFRGQAQPSAQPAPAPAPTATV